MNPTVGFIVPTLGNRLDSLIRNLKSIREQSIVSFIVIVGPQDGLRLEIDPTLFDVQISQKKPGLSNAISEGERHIPPKVKVFGWLGDDDYLEKDSLREIVGKLLSDERAVAAFGNVNYVDECGNIIYRMSPKPWKVSAILFLPNPIPQPGSLFRRSSYIEAEGINPDLLFSMDLDLFIRLSKLGRLVKIDKTIASYTWTPGTISYENMFRADMESIRVRLAHTPFWLVVPNWLNLTLQVFIANSIRKLRGIRSLHA
jgi:hypothetical protein